MDIQQSFQWLYGFRTRVTGTEHSHKISPGVSGLTGLDIRSLGSGSAAHNAPKTSEATDPNTRNFRSGRSAFQSGFSFQPFYYLQFLTLLILFSACKKDKDTEEQLPVLGRCEAVSPAGTLASGSADELFNYKTAGGGRISIYLNKSIRITHDDYPGFSLEFWGGVVLNGQSIISANHENLNGKHIKDRIGSRRSVIFPDGAKITFVADGEQGALLSVSIYENAQAHHINMRCLKLEYSTSSGSISKKLDDAEADGETSSFEINSTNLLYFNLYMENTPGNKVNDRYDLGRLTRAFPSQVNDYYDDPRLGHT
jgi:hypothetical protein